MVTILILFQFSNISANYASNSMQNPNAEPKVSISANQTLLDDVLEMPENFNTAIIGSPAIRRQTLRKNGASTQSVLTAAL